MTLAFPTVSAQVQPRPLIISLISEINSFIELQINQQIE
jgi:hypothetical protein